MYETLWTLFIVFNFHAPIDEQFARVVGYGFQSEKQCVRAAKRIMPKIKANVSYACVEEEQAVVIRY